MGPTKFQKRPVVIEAMQFTDSHSAGVILGWMIGSGATAPEYVQRGAEHAMRYDYEKDRSRGDVLENAAAFMVIPTLEGSMRADHQDLIIKGVAGEFYPCKPDIFTASYDEVV